MSRDYSNYNSSTSYKYKQGRIFTAHFGSIEVVKMQVDAWAYLI